MRSSKMRCLLAGLCCIAFALPVGAKSFIKNVKISVTNPTADEWRAADVLVPIAMLKKIAPDFRPGACIVTATEAATIEEDAATIRATELPSQVDDLDNDNHGDELVFQIDLKPNQTRIVTLSYGETDVIWRLRTDYPQRTGAMFAKKIEGVGWESERNAWRLYFDKRNAIDLFGKRRPTLQLGMFAAPDYIYHEESPNGRDIYKIGDALGIGAVGALIDGKVVKVSDVAARRWRVISSGPVRSVLEIEYEGWNVGGQKVNLKSRVTQWAGERGFTHSISAQPNFPATYVTGLPLKPGLDPVRSESDSPVTWLATYGEQVVQTGATATEAVKGEYLGLAVITTSTGATASRDDLNHLIRVAPVAEWYVLAAWDQEGSNRRVGWGNRAEARDAASYVTPSDGITTREAFLTAVRDQARKMRAPVQVKIVSMVATSQSAPVDTLSSTRHRTYAEAIDLVRQEVDQTANRLGPLLFSAPETTYGRGPGFFTEGDNKTGEWKTRDGYWWTGSFWVGELWRLYGKTHDEKYRQWADQWGSRLVGQEATQNHDVGFLYYYSSALGYDLTKRDDLKQSAIRGAQRLEKMYNPRTRLIAAWQENGDDSIIDTMMNLQLLWWASKQTGEPKWKEIGLQHALRSAELFIRYDDSVIQSVHYNPGDSRQDFMLRGGASREEQIRMLNQAKPGEWVFNHTHQGFSAETGWSRGTAWALYGFTVGYQETNDARLRVTAERVADFVIEHLPDDDVPWYDFHDEGVHFRNKDTSAGALLAGGLLRLSEVTQDKPRAQRYREQGERITRALINRYLTPVAPDDKTPPGILRHGSSTRPQDGPLTYGQYYLLDALLWLDQHPVLKP